MGIKEQAIHAAKWTSITTVSSQVISIVLSVVKYRLLDVEVFGIMAIVTSIFSILRMVQSMGFGPAIVQKETIDDIFVNTVFWVVLGISIFLSGCLMALSGWLSAFYKIEILALLLLITSAQFVFNSFIIVQNYLLARDLKFKVIGLAGLCSSVGAGLITISLAVYGYGIWSLVFGSVGSTLITFVIYLKYTKWAPSFQFSWHAIKPSAKFSLNITLQKTVAILRLSAPQLIIGKFMGTEILGMYSFAKNIILMIVNQVDAMMAQVLFPLFSRLQNDKKKLVTGYLKINHYTFLVIMPVVAGYLFVGKELIEVVYGQKWLAALTISQIILIATIVNSVCAKGSSVITAIGMPKKLLKIELFVFVPLIAALLFTAHLGILYFVITIAFGQSILFILQQIVLRKNVNLKFKGFMQCLREPFFATLAMVAILFVFQQFLPQSIDLKVALIAKVMLGSVVYFLAVFYFDKEELKSTIKLLGNFR